jgi:hypothetical protein
VSIVVHWHAANDRAEAEQARSDVEVAMMAATRELQAAGRMKEAADAAMTAAQGQIREAARQRALLQRELDAQKK